MVFYLTLIFGCQLAGEVFTKGLGLPIPGPVAGMILLFLFLLIKGGLPDDLAKVSDALLNHFSLLFVPAGVGVMLHIELLGQDFLGLSVGLLASTILTITITGLAMQWLQRISRRRGDNEDG